MKTLFTLSLIATLFFTQIIFAQDFNGTATYKTQRKMNIEMDSTHMNDDMQKQMMAMLKKQFEKEFSLEFNKNESVYKEVESLDKPTVGGNGGMQIVVAGSGAGDILYKNINENRYSNQSDLFGKLFLIQDKLEQPEWELGKETKNIGQYTCFKATYKRMVRKLGTMRMSINSEEEKKPVVNEIEQTVTAWYTLQIPVKHGPDNFNGLPGLILEINDGDQSILCSKIVINPKVGVNIEEPKKGKKVNEEEFEAIMEKKMAEMDEQFNSSRRADGNHMEIRIGG